MRVGKGDKPVDEDSARRILHVCGSGKLEFKPHDRGFIVGRPGAGRSDLTGTLGSHEPLLAGVKTLELRDDVTGAAQLT